MMRIPLPMSNCKLNQKVLRDVWTFFNATLNMRKENVLQTQGNICLMTVNHAYHSSAVVGIIAHSTPPSTTDRGIVHHSEGQVLCLFHEEQELPQNSTVKFILTISTICFPVTDFTDQAKFITNQFTNKLWDLLDQLEGDVFMITSGSSASKIECPMRCR